MGLIANIKGPTGATGAAGADGATWRSGSGAPSNGLGSNGDFYIDTVTDNVYLKSAGTYSVATNIKGSTGATGSAGATGSVGATGPAGPTHNPGIPIVHDGIDVVSCYPNYYGGPGVSLANIGSQGWMVHTVVRFTPYITVTIGKLTQRWNVASSLGANNTIMFGIFNSDLTTKLLDSGSSMKHLNSDFGMGGSIEKFYDLPFNGTYQLVAGTTYSFWQAYHASMTNGCNREVTGGSYNGSMEPAVIRYKGGTSTVNADKLKWGTEIQFVTNPDLTTPPADITALTLSGNVDLTQAAAGFLRPT